MMVLFGLNRSDIGPFHTEFEEEGRPICLKRLLELSRQNSFVCMTPPGADAALQVFRRRHRLELTDYESGLDYNCNVYQEMITPISALEFARVYRRSTIVLRKKRFNDTIPEFFLFARKAPSR